MTLAARNGHLEMLSELRKLYLELNPLMPDEERNAMFTVSPLAVATFHNHREVVDVGCALCPYSNLQYFIHHGASLDVGIRLLGVTPLMIAATFATRSTHLAKRLIEAGANVNLKAITGRTALDMCVDNRKQLESAAALHADPQAVTAVTELVQMLATLTQAPKRNGASS